MRGLYCYLPILRAKAGEFSAVRSLSPTARSRLTPLFDVTVQGIGDTRAFDTYLDQRAAGVIRAWGTTRPVYVDVHDLPPDVRTTSGAAPIACLFDFLRRHAALAIPVTGTTVDRGADYLAEVRAVVLRDRRGACLRLADDDLAEPQLLGDAVTDVLQRLSIGPEALDIVIDLRYVGGRQVGVMRATTLEALYAIRQSGQFRNLVLAGSSVPEMLGRADQGAQRREPRLEWQLWLQVLATLGSEIPLGFGDHGVVYAHFVPPKGPVKAPARIRYTTSREQVFYRAESDDYSSICRDLLASDAFSGETYSVGDHDFHRRARGHISPGSPTGWVAADTNHHLELVSAQAWHQLYESGLLDRFALRSPNLYPWLQPELVS
jgi:hypothetical protein